MTTLNRFPLLGLWAKEAALRIGYPEPDAETIGHAYAVLYAIRANATVRPSPYKDRAAAAAAAAALKHPSAITTLEFGGDRLEVSRDSRGRLVGRVGGAQPQTAESFRYKVRSKFPPGYYDRLEAAFRAFFATQEPGPLDSRTIYNLYDQWKKLCGSGRLVDLDRLLQWCRQRLPAGS